MELTARHVSTYDFFLFWFWFIFAKTFYCHVSSPWYQPLFFFCKILLLSRVKSLVWHMAGQLYSFQFSLVYVSLI